MIANIDTRQVQIGNHKFEADKQFVYVGSMVQISNITHTKSNVESIWRANAFRLLQLVFGVVYDRDCPIFRSAASSLNDKEAR